MAKAGWGERIKARARELGMTDAAVARALGVAQRRYSAYANESRQPDFETLGRICRVLGTSPDAVLGFSPHADMDATLTRIAAVVSGMAEPDRLRAAAVVDALAAFPGRPVPAPGHVSAVAGGAAS